MDLAFDAVIFDCDGVIVDSEILACRAVAELIAFYEPRADIEALVERLVGTSDDMIVKAVAAQYGTIFPDDIRQRAIDAIDTVLAGGDLRALPGITEMVAALRVPKAVASNSHRARVDRSIALAGLTQAFGPHVYTPEVVELPKPAPDLYLLAAERLGVRPSRCAVIEDSVTGSTAGLAAGMTVIGFLGGGHIHPGHEAKLRAIGVDLFCRRMDELPGVLALAEAA